MKTLYVSDMDGTLLGSDTQVSAASAELISRLSRQGAMITVATARTPATVVPLLASTYTTIPAIVMTGAARWLRSDGYYDGLTFIPPGDEHVIEEICRSCGIEPFVYTLPQDSSILQVYHGARALNHAEDSFYQERRGLQLKHFNLCTYTTERSKGRIILYFAMGEIRAIFEAGKALANNTECSVSYYPDIFNPRLAMLEVFAPGVSKASAIEQLRSDCNADRVVVFGDNLNDLSMMQIADVAVAVENALPEVKAQAEIVIGPNTADSVARWISDDFSKNGPM